MSPKLALIASLATVGVAGISTGGYFLLRNDNKANSVKSKEEQEKLPSSGESNTQEASPSKVGSQTDDASRGTVINIPSSK